MCRTRRKRYIDKLVINDNQKSVATAKFFEQPNQNLGSGIET